MIDELSYLDKIFITNCTDFLHGYKARLMIPTGRVERQDWTGRLYASYIDITREFDSSVQCDKLPS